MKFITPPPRRRDEENLIPLINIVFLLLIFFMIFARLAPNDVFKVNPPASASKEAATPEVVRILAGVDGRLAVDGDIVSLQALRDAIEQKLDAERVSAPGGQPPTITLKADADINAQQLGRILAAVRAAGSNKITLLTQRIR